MRKGKKAKFMTKGKESNILTNEIIFFPHVFYFSFILGTIFDNNSTSAVYLLYTLSEKRIVR
jgi:hypothetical protein